MIWKWTGARYEKMGWHNAFLGVPAFIACNGPSFAAVDPLSLVGPGRITIGVNNVYPKIRPDFWVGMDTPDNFESRLWWDSIPKICRGNHGENKFAGVAMKQMTATYFADVDTAANFWDWSAGGRFHWSANSFLIALQFAMWLGVRKVAFVGVDLSMDKGDYADGSYLDPAARERNARLYRDSIEFMRAFVEQASTLGVSFSSCSPDSKLNAFMPFEPVASVVARWTEGLPSGRPKLHNLSPPVPVEKKLAREQRNVVLVLRSGGEYQPEHVHRLVRQLPDCTVGLLTDFPREQFPGLYVMPLRHHWPGWWSKMEMFGPEISGDFIYLDLDTSVRELPDAFFLRNTSLGLAPFTPAEYKNLPGYHQSGMMFLREKDRAEIWKEWNKDPDGAMARHRGDQDFLHACRLPFSAWQTHFPGMVASYKMNWLPKTDEHGRPLDSNRVCVVCYHGRPRPWENAEVNWPSLTKTT